MTTRETQIAKKILDRLHELDGGQMHPLGIHAEIGGMAMCGALEFDRVLNLLDAQKLIVGIQSKHKGMLINISDAGEAARLEM